MKVLSDLNTPSFVVNRQSFINNCLRVSRTARECGMNLRPHIKTHKTIEGALLQAEPSTYSTSENDDISDNKTSRVTGFVASTIPEVKLLISGYNKNHGNCFGDILYGVPICISKIPTIAGFLIENPSIFIHVMVDNHEQVDAIEEYTRQSQNELRWTAFLKVDTGYHRAGVADDEKGVELAIRIIKSPVIDFRGIYSHCGHSYDISDKKTLQDIAQTDLSRMKSFLQSILRDDDDVIKHLSETIPLTISVGATPSTFSLPPSSSSTIKISGQTITLEMHPGNYTFFDRQQQYTNACPNVASISCRILSRVIGRYPDRGTILLDAGAIALSKDCTMQGGVCAIAGYPDLECFKASQEVTLVRVDKEKGGDFPFDEFPLGKIVGLVPNHSCLAAASFGKYYIIKDSDEKLTGDEEIVDEWIPVKGW